MRLGSAPASSSTFTTSILEAGADPNLTGMIAQRDPGGDEGAARGWS